jgi:hypothetical protein
VWIVRGEHARGDATLQAQLSLMSRHGSPLLARTRARLALSQSMQGRPQEALALLGPAMSVAPDGRWPDPRALEVELVRAAVRLDQGDAATALASLPPDSALARLPGADGGLRGEALCAAGRAAEGLTALSQYLAAEGAWLSPSSPFLARTRAMQGLCALAAGNVLQAEALARQSRRAFQMQTTASAYFKQPLERLEGALAQARGAPSARR